MSKGIEVIYKGDISDPISKKKAVLTLIDTDLNAVERILQNRQKSPVDLINNITNRLIEDRTISGLTEEEVVSFKERVQILIDMVLSQKLASEKDMEFLEALKKGLDDIVPSPDLTEVK